MMVSKLSDAQKAFIIKRGEEGSPVAEICRKAGISQTTYLTGRRSMPGGVNAKELERGRVAA